MWKNKHVIIAMIVAPILAILAWFAVGQIAGEKAKVAEPGAAYPLVARSNCRWASGKCELANNDLEMTILPLELGAQYTRLSLDSEFPLAQATFALLVRRERSRRQRGTRHLPRRAGANDRDHSGFRRSGGHAASGRYRKRVTLFRGGAGRVHAARSPEVFALMREIPVVMFP